MELAKACVNKMLEGDRMSAWLGVEVDHIDAGYCRLHFTVREEMLNGFGIVHGGVVFAAADSAFAFACNTHGRLSVALDVHINFIAACKAGETLEVEAQEIHLGHKTGVYRVEVRKEKGDAVASFTGTAYRTSRQVLATDEEPPVEQPMRDAEV